MARTRINPFGWHFADDQGVAVDRPERMLFVSGQTAMSDSGEPSHRGDLRAQTVLALQNVQAVLEAGGMSLADVVQFNTHTTDVVRFQDECADELSNVFAAHDVSPPGVLSGVTALGHPDLLVEFDAIAVR